MAEGSKTVDQALALLEELRVGGPGSAAELGRRIGISRSATGRLLTSLETHRFARRTPDGFDLGYGLLQYSEELSASLRIAAATPMRGLAARFDETIALAVRDGDDAVAIAQIVPPDRVVSVQYRPGTRHPLTIGAHGLAMLADISLTVDEIAPELVARLAEAARIGYAVSRDELEPGVTGVAAPIVVGSAAPIAAVGLIAPTGRFPEITAAAEAVTATAEQIARDLTGIPPPVR